MPIKTPTAPKRIRQSARMIEVMKLRLGGKSYREIGHALGIGSSTVQRDLHKQLAILREETEETREDLRAVEIARIDRIIAAQFNAAEAGDEKAASLILRCVAERSKLLGLYANQRVEVSGDAEAPVRHSLDHSHKHQHVLDIGNMSDEQLRELLETPPTQKDVLCPNPPAQSPESPPSDEPPAPSS